MARHSKAPYFHHPVDDLRSIRRGVVVDTITEVVLLGFVDRRGILDVAAVE